ncbi:NAD(P)/FAD-dependent oxidoreductase [Phycisphaerales bacterium AB-hyl4]|uniref:NAD(P)/FAD-dependent oxidoreductase n=1 Tax=Natronomicrosphaera hydrolytica TaxID=3242702 RepID=A0ABV4U1B4_9BACT
MTERYDIAIIGAGPAGAMSAYRCAQHGAAVLLVDKARFPRAKTCGGCLGGEAIGVLERAGLATVHRSCDAQPLHALRLATAGRSANVPLAGGFAVSRRRFDHALVQTAVAAGVTFHDDTNAVVSHDNRVMLRHRGDGNNGGASRQVHARVLMVADGIAGTCLADRPGFDWHVARRARVGFGAVLPGVGSGYEPGVIHMAVGRAGYVGVVEVEGGQLDIAAAVDARAMQQLCGPAATAARLLHDAGLPAIDGLNDASWRGTPWLTRHRRRVADDGLLLIGDATGYVEPFTGEGIGWALCSAEAATPLALNAIAKPAMAHRWTKHHRQLFAARHRRCRLIATLLRRPALMRLAVALLDQRPALAHPITRRLALGA